MENKLSIKRQNENHEAEPNVKVPVYFGITLLIV